MSIRLFPKYKKINLTFFWNIVFLCFFILSSCGDLIKESDSAACNSAIDSRNYDEALSVCSSRKDKASAYMGKAGYDIINLLKSSKSTVSAYTKPTNAELGTDDVAGGSILNILQLSVDSIENDTTRAEAITKSRIYLDNATSLLQPHLNDNSSPLSKDELLLNTFAISFAMQLNQLEIYDNKSATTLAYPSFDGDGEEIANLECATVSNSTSDSDAKSKLKAMDGHLWTTERNSMQCNRILVAINGLTGSAQATAFTNFKAWVDNESRGALPEPFDTVVCEPIGNLTQYLADLTSNIAKLTLSGDNTKAITNAKTSSDALLKAVGCLE